MKNLTFILVVAFFVKATDVISQTLDEQSKPRQANVLSPQGYEFGRVGNGNVSHFTGQPEIDIPIYTYTDRDFSIPLSLTYNASGFSPSEREGIAGLNWFLNNGGGAIVRYVNGLPDDKPSENLIIRPHGSIAAIKLGSSITSRSKASVFELSNGQLLTTMFWGRDNSEVEPDDFRFSFPGFAGRFFIAHDGTVKTSGDRPFKVDLSNFNNQPDALNTFQVNDSEIKVTTDDGYIFTFGGTIQFLEVSFPLTSLQQTGSYPTIVAWHIREIKAPNGRVASFQYVPYSETRGEFVPAGTDPYHYLYNKFAIELLTSSAECFPFQEGPFPNVNICNETGGLITDNQEEVTKTVYLKRILIDSVGTNSTANLSRTTIEFRYEECSKALYPETAASIPFYNQKNLQVKSIGIKSGGAELKRFVFGYRNLGGINSKRRFLISFREEGLMPYTFSYRKTDDFPRADTHGIDHWGYWNGGWDAGSEMTPGAWVYANGDEVIPDDNIRKPDTTKMDVGLLAQITYPSGGYTRYRYQPHEYATRLERRKASNFMPALFAATGYAGGARVWKIYDYDGVKTTNVREYKYVKDFASGGTTSSGILLSWPRYRYYWHKHDDSGSDGDEIRIRNFSFHRNNYYPGEYFMQYSEVTELQLPENGYTNFKYSSYESDPDVSEYDTLIANAATQTMFTPLNLYNNFVGKTLNDCSNSRGRIKEVTHYASKSAGVYYPVSKSVTTYTGLSQNTDDWVVSVHGTGGIIQSSKIYYYPVLPLQRSETFYSGEGTASQTMVTNFTYNAQNYLATEAKVRSDGKAEGQSFKYPSDLINEIDQVNLFTGNPIKYSTLSQEVKAIVDLRMNNIINAPIETINYVGAPTTGAVDAKYVQHLNFGADLSKKSFPYKAFTLKTKKVPAGVTHMSINKTTWLITRSALYDTVPDMVYQYYDALGNILQQRDRSKNVTAFQWGYSGLYPVAQAVNTTYNRFFATSFEDDAASSTGDSFTGRRYKDGTYTVSLNVPAGNYTLSYWKKQTSGGWIEVRQPVTVSSTPYSLSTPGGIQIDELRFVPTKATIQVLTFTYDPLVGMTSKVDANIRPSYFVYDEWERLRLVKDENGDIVKRYVYFTQAR